MLYKGYSATVAIDTTKGVMYGMITGISETVKFEAKNVASLTKNFEKAVEDYIKKCEDSTILVTAPASGNHPLKMKPGLHAVGKKYAADKGSNFNTYVVGLIKADLEKSHIIGTNFDR